MDAPAPSQAPACTRSRDRRARALLDVPAPMSTGTKENVPPQNAPSQNAAACGTKPRLLLRRVRPRSGETVGTDESLVRDSSPRARIAVTRPRQASGSARPTLPLRPPVKAPKRTPIQLLSSTPRTMDAETAAALIAKLMVAIDTIFANQSHTLSVRSPFATLHRTPSSPMQPSVSSAVVRCSSSLCTTRSSHSPPSSTE